MNNSSIAFTLICYSPEQPQVVLTACRLLKKEKVSRIGHGTRSPIGILLRRLCVPHLPCNHVSNTFLWPTLGYVLEYTHFEPNVLQTNHRTSSVKNICPLPASITTFPRLDDFGALQTSVDVRETAGSRNYFLSQIDQASAEDQSLNEVVQPDGYHESAESTNNHLKRRRKRKGKHGNTGSIPWNKGRKHTAETRALIKQRTIEAMRNPQVRKKMTEHHRAHSEEVKAKISSSLRQLWDRRLKWKRLREKFILSWAKSIAKAAKEGGIDQQELDWDGYDKVKEETAPQQLQGAVKKAKAKEKTKRKEERKARVAQKKKEQVDREKAGGEAKKNAYKRSKKKADDSTVAQKLTLQQRLTKIRKKKYLNDLMISQGASSISRSPAWEKLDVELRKNEKFQSKTSLADQIRAAKDKRSESNSTTALASLSALHLHINTVS